MDDAHRQLFDRLIIAAGTLATVSDQAATVLSEEFESLVRPSIDNVRSILHECPTPMAAWDGVSFRDEDLDISIYKTGYEPVNVGPAGVKIVHLPTGIGRQSESKPSQIENREVAFKALRQAVASYQERL